MKTQIIITILILLILIGCNKELTKQTQDKTDITKETITTEEIDEINIDNLTTEDIDNLEEELSELE